MGIQETILRAAIPDLTHISKRGFGYGIFNTAYGLALLAGNTIMGALYSTSIAAIFLFIVVIEILALPFLFLLIKRSSKVRTGRRGKWIA